MACAQAVRTNVRITLRSSRADVELAKFLRFRPLRLSFGQALRQGGSVAEKEHDVRIRKDEGFWALLAGTLLDLTLGGSAPKIHVLIPLASCE